MLIYLAILTTLFIAYAIYKYFVFRRRSICTSKSSFRKFFRFWLKSIRQKTQWEHFINGQGAFRPTEKMHEEQAIYGGGISGTW